jgi:hypothetical protein
VQSNTEWAHEISNAQDELEAEFPDLGVPHPQGDIINQINELMTDDLPGAVISLLSEIQARMFNNDHTAADLEILHHLQACKRVKSEPIHSLDWVWYDVCNDWTLDPRDEAPDLTGYKATRSEVGTIFTHIEHDEIHYMMTKPGLDGQDWAMASKWPGTACHWDIDEETEAIEEIEQEIKQAVEDDQAGSTTYFRVVETPDAYELHISMDEEAVRLAEALDVSLPKSGTFTKHLLKVCVDDLRLQGAILII